MFKVIEALISDANTGNTKQLSGREKLLGLSRNGPQGPVVRRPGTQPGVKFESKFLFLLFKSIFSDFSQKHFFAYSFIAPSRQIKDNKNETEFAF